MISNLYRKPLSFSTLIIATIGSLYSIYSILTNNWYIETFNWVDTTTIFMVSVLLLRGIFILKENADLKIFSLSLINALSFIFCFEAIYKFLFFGWVIYPAELRELLLQIATALTVLVGFAYTDFRLTTLNKSFLSLFVVTMVIWVSLGYPQLFEVGIEEFYIFGYKIEEYPQLIPIDVSQNMVYLINRLAKVFLFLGYFYLFKRK